MKTPSHQHFWTGSSWFVWGTSHSSSLKAPMFLKQQSKNFCLIITAFSCKTRRTLSLTRLLSSSIWKKNSRRRNISLLRPFQKNSENISHMSKSFWKITIWPSSTKERNTSGSYNISTLKSLLRMPSFWHSDSLKLPNMKSSNCTIPLILVSVSTPLKSNLLVIQGPGWCLSSTLKRERNFSFKFQRRRKNQICIWSLSKRPSKEP